MNKIVRMITIIALASTFSFSQDEEIDSQEEQYTSLQQEEEAYTSTYQEEYTSPTQEPPKEGGEGGVKFGVRAAFNLLAFAKNSYSAEFGMGFGGGIIAKIPFTETFVLHPEVGVSWRKGKLPGENSFVYGGYINSDSDVDVTELVISVPVLFQYRYKGTVVGALGPQVDIPISSEITTPDGTYTYKSRSAFDLGIAAVVGYQISESLGFEIKAFRSLTSPDSDEYFSWIEQLGFGLSYLF